jgi:spermidine/putrescine transport system permease protein
MRYGMHFIAVSAFTASVILTYLFLYIPIIVLIVFSFNSSSFPDHWVSFTFDWYRELFNSPEILSALKTSLIVALTSVFLSICMAVAFVYYSARTWLSRFLPLFYANLIIPELVLAVGLLSVFTFFNVPLGITTLIAGHTMIGLGFAIPMIEARLHELDFSIIEASRDLGATEHETFLFVVLPLLRPALFAAGLLVFIISFDDFLISFFCSGSSSQTLSLYIFAMIRTGVTPTVNALSAILLIISSVLVVIFSSLQVRMF